MSCQSRRSLPLVALAGAVAVFAVVCAWPGKGTISTPAARLGVQSDSGPDSARSDASHIERSDEEWAEERRNRHAECEAVCGYRPTTLVCDGSACGVVLSDIPEPRWLRHWRRPATVYEEAMMALTGDSSWSTCVQHHDCWRGAELHLVEGHQQLCVVATRPGRASTKSEAQELCASLGFLPTPSGVRAPGSRPASGP